MRYIIKRIKISSLLAFCTWMIFSSCNKDLEQFPDPAVVAPSGLALGETLAASASDSLFYNIVKKGGMTATLNNKANTYTLFVPDNAAVIASFGGSLASANGTIAALPAASCAGIVLAHFESRSLLRIQADSNIKRLTILSIHKK